LFFATKQSPHERRLLRAIALAMTCVRSLIETHKRGERITVIVCLLWFNWAMIRPRFSLRPNLLAVALILFLAPACSPTAAPTLFRPPTISLPTETLPTTTPIPQIFTLVPPTLSPATPTEIPPCTNNLTFVDDITIEDGTVILPGATIDKQWLVTNSGTCNWDSRYRLKLISGDTLGAATEQALYPARAGTQTTLRILFTAPIQIGTYQSAWQAYNPDGIAFGDPVYINIVVQ
jgi:hypothetical protein